VYLLAGSHSTLTISLFQILFRIDIKNEAFVFYGYALFENLNVDTVDVHIKNTEASNEVCNCIKFF
jgi:hypothetical protein